MNKTIGTAKDIIDLLKSVKEAWPVLLLIPGGVFSFFASLPSWVPWLLAFFAALLIFFSLYRIRRVLFYKPLAAAAQEAFEQLDGGVYAAAAERMHDEPSPERTLEYMGQLLINHGDVKVFGLRAPSRVFQQIPPEVVKRSAVKSDCAVLESTNEREPRWSELHLLRSEFRARLKQMKTEDWQEGTRTAERRKTPEVSKSEQLLRGAADPKSSGQILIVSGWTEPMIQVGNEVMNDTSNPRSTAEWEDAVAQLADKGHVALETQNSTLKLYKLTAKGYAFLDALDQAA